MSVRRFSKKRINVFKCFGMGRASPVLQQQQPAFPSIRCGLEEGGVHHMLHVVDREKTGAEHQQQSTRWRVPVCLARRPDVPSTRCDGRASGQGRTTLWRYCSTRQLLFPCFLPRIAKEKGRW